MRTEEIRPRHARAVAKFLLILLALLLLMVLCNRLDGHHNVRVKALFAGGLAPWTNALPAMMLMLALLGLTRRLALSFWLSVLGTALLYGISALKMAALANPLTRQDFMLIGQIGGDSSLFMRYLPWSGGLVFLLLAALLVTWALAAWEPPLLHPRKHLRLSVAGISVALLISLAGGLAPWRSIYASGTLDYRPWESAATQSRRQGMVGNLMMAGLYAPSAVAMISDPAPGKALFAAHQEAVGRLMQQVACGRAPGHHRVAKRVVLRPGHHEWLPCRRLGAEPAPTARPGAAR